MRLTIGLLQGQQGLSGCLSLGFCLCCHTFYISSCCQGRFFGHIFNVLWMIALATFSDGCLGSNTDEGRSEVWWALWIAEFRESIVTWMCIALSGYPWKHVCFRVYVTFCQQSSPQLLWWYCCACLCVKGSFCALGTCSLLDTLLYWAKCQVPLALLWLVLHSFASVGRCVSSCAKRAVVCVSPRHEVRPANPLNLSI